MTSSSAFQLTQDSSSQEPSAQAIALPLMTQIKFSELSGIPIGVLKGFVSRGYIPVLHVGKYSLINISLLNQMALNKAPWA